MSVMLKNASIYFFEGCRSLNYLPGSLPQSTDLQEKLRKVLLLLPCNEPVEFALKSANSLYAATAFPAELGGAIADLRNPAKSLFEKAKRVTGLGANAIDFVTGFANVGSIAMVSIAKKIGSISIFANRGSTHPTFKEVTDKLSLTKNVLVCSLTLSNLVQNYRWSLSNDKPITNKPAALRMFDRVADVTKVVFLGLLILSATTMYKPETQLFSVGKRVLTLKTVTDGACYLSTGAAFFKTLYKLTPAA